MSKYENCVQAAMAQWRNFLNISIMKNETEVFVMKDKTYHAYLDSHERQLVIHSLEKQTDTGRQIHGLR